MSTFQTGLTSDLSVARLGTPLGFAPLGADNKVPSIHLPASVAGGLALQGGYDASTNIPDLTAAPQQSDGALYITTVEGTQDIGNGSELFSVGDAVFYSTGDARWYCLQSSVLGIEVVYDNSGTSIVAANVQDAITELAATSAVSNWKIIDVVTAYTAVSGDLLAFKNAASLTLPTTPSDGDVIKITDYTHNWGANNLNVNTSSTINGEAAPFCLDVGLKYGEISFIYDTALDDWGLLISYLGEVTSPKTADSSITADTSFTADAG